MFVSPDKIKYQHMRNFFKLALRNIFRQKLYSFLNLIGLALGISCGLLLSLHIREELSYEKSFPKHDRIYRMVTTEWSKSSPPLAAEMMKSFPEIKSTARFSEAGLNVINTEQEKQTEGSGLFADSSAAEVFDFKSVAGNVVAALSEPFAVVLTKSLSTKLFGNNNPLNQKLTVGDRQELWVRAVIEDMPENTHLKFDYLVSMPTFYKYVPPDWTNSRGWAFGWTYVLFNDKEDINKAEKKLKAFYLKYHEGMFDTKQALEEDAASARFQPLTAIHLHSDLIQEMGPNSSIIYIYIFIAVEIMVLIIACVNFINLFTTQALKRMKEVGIRKILGAKKRQVILQFIGEAFLLTFFAAIVAVAIYQVALPFYNNIAGKHIGFLNLFSSSNIVIFIGIIVFVGLISGLFPALFISRFEPINSLKQKNPKSPAIFLRKSLVVFQFIVSGLLITSTILIYQQMQLFNNKQLGFDKEQVMVAKLYGNFKEKIITNPDIIKNELLKNPDIISIGGASNVIGDDLSVESVTPVNSARSKEFPTVRVMRIDDQYLNALNIKVKEGRNFSRAFNDSASFILNEAAVKALQLDQPLNAAVKNNTFNIQGRVIGIINDFNYTSLQHQVEPLVLQYDPWSTDDLFIKIKAGKTVPTISFLKTKIAQLSPNTLFSYGFLDEKIAGLYSKENNMSEVLKIFALLSIIISCLGLFGLIAHAAERRTKEIGIRKVIGARMSNIVILLSKDFLLLVIIGNIIAMPLTWYGIHKWLEEFTYRINISWTVFAVSLFASLVIALFTLSWQSIKTASINPVKSLRSE
jgi:putative ABC transport system permease protein